MGVPPTSVSAIEALLERQFGQPLPGAAAQRRFAPTPWLDGWQPNLLPESARHAAALILVCPDAAGLAVPLTVRHAGLARHAGQVSLPGGALDPGESRRAAALREAEEEIGVPADRVRILGALSTLWIAVSNFIVHPFVGVAHAAPDFRVRPGEVEHLVKAPLAHLADPSRVRWESRERFGTPVRYPFFDVDGHRVWGATAMILGEFLCLLDPSYRPRRDEYTDKR